MCLYSICRNVYINIRVGEFESPQEETVTFSRVSISNDLIFQSAATLFYYVFTCCGLLLILPQLTANESKACHPSHQSQALA